MPKFTEKASFRHNTTPVGAVQNLRPTVTPSLSLYFAVTLELGLPRNYVASDVQVVKVVSALTVAIAVVMLLEVQLLEPAYFYLNFLFSHSYFYYFIAN